MIIVGINAYHADAAAAIFVDGRLVAAIEEERFTRTKHWAGFPAQAIEFCLQAAGVRFRDVDHFAIGRDPGAKLFRKMAYLAADPFHNMRAVKDRMRNSIKVRSVADELSALSRLVPAHFKGRIHKIEHHRSHIASAFYASPFTEAACLSIDGSGDFST